MLIHLENREDFEREIKEGIVIVDFYAGWCGPCKMLSPELERLSEEENVKVVKVNVDEFIEIAQRFRVMNIPTILLYKDGNLVKKNIGFMPLSGLKEFIK